MVEAVERLLDGGASFTELSVQAIAEEAGIARSTFYVHFADKTQLLITLAQEATADIVAEGERWIRSDHLVDIDQLTPSIGRIIAVYRRHARLFEAVLAGTGYDPAVAAFWRRHIELLVARGRTVFAEHSARGTSQRTSTSNRWRAWSRGRSSGRSACTPSTTPSPTTRRSPGRWPVGSG